MQDTDMLTIRKSSSLDRVTIVDDLEWHLKLILVPLGTVITNCCKYNTIISVTVGQLVVAFYAE